MRDRLDWSRVKTVFQSALELPDHLRPSFVTEACGSDSLLRAEVESLLIAHDAAGAFASADALASLSTASLYELSAMDPDLGPGARIGNYEIVGLIGRGSMGQIFKARDSRLGRVVALKVLSPDLVPDPASRVRFDREAKTIASLNHPHICTLFDVGHSGQFEYLVMEYLEGKTLGEILQCGPLPVDATRRYAAEMIDALDTAHRSGVVHRDLKPANVIITDTGAKLLDFGIAKMIGHDGGGSAPGEASYGTRQGSVIGTAGYMCPEQARGQAVDERADIWAFGCVLFEMLSGHPAFARDTLSDTLVVVLEREPEWTLLPATTPQSLRRLMRRCLQKDPSRRLRDIADARADIDDLDAGLAQSEAVAAPSRLVRALPWVIAAGAIGLITLMVTQTRRDVAPPSPLRLSLVPPGGATWAPFDISGAPQFALSPDGKQIALVVADTIRVPRLWVRALGSTNGRTLAGTEHASGPFWSPDGTAIAFFADRKLKRVLLESGSIQELAVVAQDVAGGSWSRNGTILFGGPGTGLLRVSAEGGPVTTVTVVNSRAGELVHAWPQFLDGRRFLFYVRNRDRAASGTYIGSIDSPTRTLVLASTVRAIYAPTGHLLFERAGNLMAQLFDDTSGRLTGQAIALPDRVVPLNAPSWLPVSAGGEAIAYWSGDGRPTFDLNMVDTSGHAIRQVLPPGQYLAVDLSPDGSRALVTERIDSENDALWMIDLQTGARVRVTLAPGLAHFGIWAPDSTQVIYSSLEDGVPRLYRKAVRGNSPEVPVVPSLRQPNMIPTDWSRNGQWVLYSSAPGATAWDVFALRIADWTAHPVVEGRQNQIQARLSPNARWITYASDETGQFEIYVQSFDDPSDKTLVSTRGGSQPTWRRDGRELFYVAADGTMMAVPVTSESRFEHFAERALFHTRSQEVLAPFTPSYAAGADGQKFLIRSESPMRPDSTITVVANALADVGPR